MAAQDCHDRIWDIVETVGVCMLTTHSARGLRARPLEARPDREAGLIWFVTDLHSGKEHEIEAERDVGLVFIDAKDKAYLSITARAEVTRDHAKAAEIWKSTDDVWWKGPNDPNVCVLRVIPVVAELWDGPASKAVAMYEFAKARLTGEKPNLGENRKVTVRMQRLQSPTKRSAPVSATYGLVWRAIRQRKLIAFTYKTLPRVACPIILGYSEEGEEVVSAYQVDGRTSGNRELPAWGCFYLAKAEDLSLQDGDWKEGKSHKQAQSCVRHVDADVNIPDTLLRNAPLPFGSPLLRPPRTKP